MGILPITLALLASAANTSIGYSADPSGGCRGQWIFHRRFFVLIGCTPIGSDSASCSILASTGWSVDAPFGLPVGFSLFVTEFPRKSFLRERKTRHVMRVKVASLLNVYSQKELSYTTAPEPFCQTDLEPRRIDDLPGAFHLNRSPRRSRVLR